MAEGIRDTILPTHVTELPWNRPQGADEAHAPGHRHLPIDEVEDSGPARLRGRTPTEHPDAVHPHSRT